MSIKIVCYTNYKIIRDIVEENQDNRKIIEGLDNWIKHIELNALMEKVFGKKIIELKFFGFLNYFDFKGTKHLLQDLGGQNKVGLRSI